MNTKRVTRLAKFTEYELQVLAFTSVGDGPKSFVQFAKTKEDGEWYCLNWWILTTNSLEPRLKPFFDKYVLF